MLCKRLELHGGCSCEVENLNICICIIRHGHGFFAIDGDFAKDVAVVFNDHAVIVDGCEFNAAVIANREDGAIFLGFEGDIAADGVGAHEEFNDVDDEPVGKDEEAVSGQNGEAPHHERLNKDVGVNVFIDIVEQACRTEATKATIEQTGHRE